MVKKNLKNMDASRVAKNVKMFIKKEKISKSVLVAKTGLDYHTIAKIENGTTPDPRVSTLIKIARALNQPIGNLVK